MGVSENSGTPKSSILIGFSIINIIQFGGKTLFLETPISTLLTPNSPRQYGAMQETLPQSHLVKAAAEMKRLEKIGRMWITFLATVSDVIKGFEMLLWNQMRFGTSC